MSLMKWLGLTTADGKDDGNHLEEIERILAPFGRDRARYLACFAYILTRPARADHQVSDDEAQLMQQLITARTGVSTQQAATIVQIAREGARKSGGTEDFLITREFERIATREEKLELVDCLFAIGAADQSILTVEDNEVRRVASELNLEHSDYIEVRRKHVAKLKVLQRPAE